MLLKSHIVQHTLSTIVIGYNNKMILTTHFANVELRIHFKVLLFTKDHITYDPDFFNT